jgi:hypothetical protein
MSVSTQDESSLALGKASPAKPPMDAPIPVGTIITLVYPLLAMVEVGIDIFSAALPFGVNIRADKLHSMMRRSRGEYRPGVPILTLSFRNQHNNAVGWDLGNPANELQALSTINQICHFIRTIKKLFDILD